MPITRFRRFIAISSTLAAGAIMSVSLAMGPPGDQVQIPSTIENFDLLGTQPSDDAYELAAFQSHQNCIFCHGDYSVEVSPIDTWVVSLMGQAARDPVWHAAVSIANQDVHVSGSFCIRCHSTPAYMRDGAPTGVLDIASAEDADGVNCTTCHRMVNPTYGPDSAVGYPGDPADPDLPIISDLTKSGDMPDSIGNAQIIFDPGLVRRAQYDDVPENYHGVDNFGEPIRLITSPYHQKSQLCGSCHDVGNPLFHKVTQGRFELNDLEKDPPTTDVLRTTPEQRTFSEWLHSDFATTGVVFEDGRFGGSLPDTEPIRSCQNCHMPPQVGGACAFWENPPFFERDDVGAHSFAGGNSWVLSALRRQLGDEKGGEADYLGLTQERVDAANARTLQMLQDASDMQLAASGNELTVTVINQSGHKLPTGYPEGRRMWLNVRFFDDGGDLINEYGAYDYNTAILSTGDTKVYEKKMGISPDVASVVNLPAGESFHLSLNNYVIKDNCIPPRGFTNANFASFDGQPVDYSYADGDYSDDTSFSIPNGAVVGVATLYFQTSSKEYIEFLRDTNLTDNRGDEIYDLWQAENKSAPVAMDSMEIELADGNPADLNGDGQVNGADLGLMLAAWGTSGPGDLNNDGVVNGADLGLLLAAWFN